MWSANSEIRVGFRWEQEIPVDHTDDSAEVHQQAAPKPLVSSIIQQFLVYEDSSELLGEQERRMLLFFFPPLTACKNIANFLKTRSMLAGK